MNKTYFFNISKTLHQKRTGKLKKKSHWTHETSTLVYEYLNTLLFIIFLSKSNYLKICNITEHERENYAKFVEPKK